MISNINKTLETRLMALEPVESMPDFGVVWNRYKTTGGISGKESRIKPGSILKKFISVPVFALAASIIVIILLFGPKPFTTEGEWFNKTDHFINVNWKGHRVAISPGGHIRLSFPAKENRSVQVVLYSGKILCHPQKLVKGENFIVMLSDAEISVHGTVFSVLADRETRRVSVTEGIVKVLFKNDSSTQDLREGQTLEWVSKGARKVRTLDGRDLSDLSIEMKLEHWNIKRWAIGISEKKGPISASSGGDCLWMTEGPVVWKMNGPKGAAIIFRQSTSENVSRPSVFNDKIMIANPLGGSWVMDHDGKIKNVISGSPGFRELASPEIYGKYAVCPTYDAYLWVYDMITGSHFVIEAPEGDTIFGSPVIDAEKDHMYYSTGSGKLIKYDLRSRKVLDEVSVFSERIVFPVIKSGNKLILFDRKSGMIACLPIGNLHEKTIIIKQELKNTESVPVVVDNRIYFYNESDKKGRLFEVDTGLKIFDCKLIRELGEPVTGISGYGDTTVVSTSAGKIYIFNEDRFEAIGKMTGKIVGADKNGAYIINREYLDYYSFDVMAPDKL